VDFFSEGGQSGNRESAERDGGPEDGLREMIFGSGFHEICQCELLYQAQK